jgi:tetratricopeptide (TPR) repeat protein
VIYLDKGNLDEALISQKKALKLREEVLGDKHPDLAKSYNNISTIYQDLKECLEAKKFSIKAIDILKQLDYISPDMASFKKNLKSTEVQIKKQKKAKFKDKGRFCKDET